MSGKVDSLFDIALSCVCALLHQRDDSRTCQLATFNTQVQFLPSDLKHCIIERLKRKQELNKVVVQKIAGANGSGSSEHFPVLYLEFPRSNIDDECVTDLINPHVRGIDFSYCAHITPTIITAVAICSNLTCLRLDFCQAVNATSLRSVLLGCRKIQILSLRGDDNIRCYSLPPTYDPSGTASSHNMKEEHEQQEHQQQEHEHEHEQEQQEREEERFRTDTLLLLHLLHDLRELNVEWISSFCDRHLALVALHCPQLQLLDVSNCTQLSNLSLDWVLRSCPRIQVIAVRGLTKLSLDMVQRIGGICRSAQFGSGCGNPLDSGGSGSGIGIGSSGTPHHHNTTTRKQQLDLFNATPCN